MKYFTIALSILVLGALLIISPAALSQTEDTTDRPGQDQARNRILIAINRAELSLEQLQTLQSLVQDTISLRDQIVAAQEAFQAFLENWTGSAEDFDAALEEEQQKLRDLATSLHELWRSNEETIKDMLTANQYEILRPVLDPVIGRPERRQAQGQGRPDRRGPSLREEIGVLNGLDLLDEVLTEKIELLQNQ